MSEPKKRDEAERAKFRDSLSRRGIDVLYHATWSAALSAIDHTGGVHSTNSRTNPPFPLPSAGQPIDGLAAVYRNHVCLSVRPFWAFIAELTRRTQNSVCLLAVDARIVELEGVAFSPRLRRDAKSAAAELDRVSFSDFEALFPNGSSSAPTHPSAKILVPGKVPVSYIKEVVFSSEAERDLAKSISPGALGPCVVDPGRFPAAATDLEMKVNWPQTAADVQEFWMCFMGLLEG